ncbi:XRE family transcriptional regulator [Streptomyces sp. H10-C2]|uniref:helix-turn-helix domain-containing protein n=1 Tax=unclassified Streptomyces TaxID=2593676 RepID=UPI0024BA9D94|nr:MULTISPECIES: XRE family transcriptional regulator [unclassified Streptomyces]MDJ0347518.1 XRE family transcriptional regulator [Streptomyces sp. PH10-H1]MDJ0368565.1 XRE family transcriptional regulator [Streptomyces sp. H10-C2]
MPDLEIVAQSLARNVKRLRLERGYSLDALAARAGVSRGMIIQIEQARTNPSIGTVVRIADAVGISIASLLDHADSPQVRLVPADRAVPLWSTPAGSYGTLQAGTEAPGPLELWSWRLMPGEGHDSDAHPPGSAELIRVDAGELTLIVEGQEHHVPAGTTASFDAHVPHGYHNAGPVPAEMTLAISVPPPR